MRRDVYDGLISAIDLATAPNKMTQAEALEILEELAADLAGRIEALSVEMDNGPGE